MNRIIFSLAIVFSMGTASLVCAEETVMADTQKTAAVEVGNKICPVSGEKVGEMGEPSKVEYKGKVYSLCCPACEKEFLKDPEKFAKIAEDEVAAAAAAETAEPVKVE